MFKIYLQTFSIAFLVSVLLTPIIMKLAIKANMFDRVNERKVHTRPTPRLGGLAIFLGFMIAVIYILPINRQLMGILIGSSLIFILGFVDDIVDLPAKFKFVCQFIAAFILVAFGVTVEPVGSGFLSFKPLVILFTVIWVVGVTNAVNLIDGLDGLASGFSAIAALTLFVIAIPYRVVVAIMAMAILGSVIGFLPYNFSPAKIFVGDGGATFLGFMLATLAMIGTLKKAATLSLILPIMILAVPVLDTLFAIFRRYKGKRPIFQADKDHLHHRLMKLGLSDRLTVLIIYSISACLGAISIILTRLDFFPSIIIIVIIALVLWVAAKRVGLFGIEEKSHPNPPE